MSKRHVFHPAGVDGLEPRVALNVAGLAAAAEMTAAAHGHHGTVHDHHSHSSGHETHHEKGHVHKAKL
jgi:hypothetical protein